jgi:hypothetical protein
VPGNKVGSIYNTTSESSEEDSEEETGSEESTGCGKAKESEDFDSTSTSYTL